MSQTPDPPLPKELYEWINRRAFRPRAPGPVYPLSAFRRRTESRAAAIRAARRCFAAWLIGQLLVAPWLVLMFLTATIPPHRFPPDLNGDLGDAFGWGMTIGCLVSLVGAAIGIRLTVFSWPLLPRVWRAFGPVGWLIVCGELVVWVLARVERWL